MTDKTVEKIVKLMKDPEHIRNICTSAHIDHGKCVSGSSRVMLKDGSVMKAEELFAASAKFSRKEIEDNEKTVYDVSREDLFTYSVNPKTGDVESKKITHAWKLKGGKLISVRLRNGFELATTPEHQYLTYYNKKLVYKQASELKEKDLVVCPRKTLVEPNINIKKTVLKLLSKGDLYVKLDKNFAEELKSKILSKSIESISKIVSDIKPVSFGSGMRKGRYSLKTFVELCILFRLNLGEAYDKITGICYRNGLWRGKSSHYIKLPSNFEHFFYLAGLLVGDGSHKKFVVGKPELGKKFTDYCYELGITTGKRNYSYRTPELVSNETLARVFNLLFDYPLKKKSRNVSISAFVFRSPNNLIANFLSAYFDCDGTVEKSRSAVSISSASTQMIDDLKLLLPRFGIMPIAQGDTLYISGNSGKEFVNQIGFGLEEKNSKAIKLANKSTGGRVCDLNRSIEISTQTGLVLSKLLTEQLALIEVKSISTKNEEFVYDFTTEDYHNFMAEGISVHNTTFSDSLIAGAGMMSSETAGKQLVLDFKPDEQARGITIDAANVSMVHELNGQEYLINLIDTPGHVDFGGDVTRAMRAIDGTILLVDAVEGVMPQTETVLRQALKERVQPVLFINKVDRLIKELQLTPEQMQEKFMKVITHVNKLIEQLAEPEFKEKWKVDVNKGTVAFGSAYNRWALSIPYMKETGITFKDIISAYSGGSDQNEKLKELANKAPLHKIILNMTIRFHPTPAQAQSYRITKIWHGDPESETGKSLIGCDPNGPVVFVCTKIVIDKNAGEIAAGRLFSGTVKQGQDIYLIGAKQAARAQQVFVYNGAKREQVEEAAAGNVIGIVGLRGIASGETVASSDDIEPFEAIKHIFEPVVTKAIEAKNAADLPKLVEVLRQVSKEDPTLVVEINEETGEHLISGMGELHLEVIENRILTEKGVEVKTSEPIVVYRETISKKSIEVEGKSPNKHNKFYMIVEPLPPQYAKLFRNGDIPSTLKLKKKEQEIWGKLEAEGMDSKMTRKIKEFFNGSMLIDQTRGQVHIGEVIEMVMDAFNNVMTLGPVAREPCTGVIAYLMDMKLHEDAIHRGPAQVLPAVRESIRGAMLNAGPALFEPLQVLQIDSPATYMGAISKLVQNRRGQLLEMNQEGEMMTVQAKLPVAETFGLTSDLRSSTEGRGSFYVVDQVFEKLPSDLQAKIAQQIRDRKGLKLIEGIAMPGHEE